MGERHTDHCNCYTKEYACPPEIAYNFNVFVWIIDRKICEWSTRPRTIPRLKQETSMYPKIAGKFLNQVLLKKLYEMSFPTIRRKLWLSSKKTSGLGQKPVIYFVDWTRGSGYYDPVIQNCHNTVFFLNRKLIAEKGIDFKSQRFFEFEHIYTLLCVADLSPKNFPVVLTENVETLSFDYGIADIKEILKFVPNLKVLIDCEMPDNWEQILMDFNDMKYIGIDVKQVNDWKLLSEFISRQNMNFEMEVWSDYKIDENEMLKYLKFCDSNVVVRYFYCQIRVLERCLEL